MTQPESDRALLANLSPAAQKVLQIDVATAYSKLVPDVPGSSDARDAIDLLSADNLLSGRAVGGEQAGAILAGLWLWHDFLDESHRLSQANTTATGSYWHAIMHRREGDFSNSKYWYNRCAAHPILRTLCKHIEDITRAEPADKSIFRLTSDSFNPAAFVDLVEAIHNQPADPRHRLAVLIQQAEWKVLFEHCVRAAHS